MSGTAPNPTQDLLRDQLNPVGDSSAAPASQSASASATEAVLLSRLVGVETQQDLLYNAVAGLSDKFGKLLEMASSAKETEPPAPTAASSGAPPVTSTDAEGFVKGSDFPRHSPAAQLSDGSASLTNGNFASRLPEIDAQTKALIAGGGDLPAATSSKGGTIQLYCLTPAHVVNESGKADRSSSGLKFMQDPDSSMLSLCASPSLPGNGKKFTAKQLQEKLPTPFAYAAAAKKCADMMQSAGFMTASQRLLYDNVYMPRINTLFETCMVANPTEGYPLALAIDQEIRFFQFDHSRPWDSEAGMIEGSIHQRGLAMLYSGVSPFTLGTNLTPTATTKPSAVAAASGAAAAPGNPAPTGRGGPRTYTAPAYKDLLQAIPQAFRASCCLAFYQTGRCRRTPCTYAATGHKCFLCQSTNHGTAQCPGQAAAPAGPRPAGAQ